MTNVAIHLVGMMRNFDLTVHSFLHLANLAAQNNSNKIIFFVSVWDKYTDHDWSAGRVNKELLDVDQIKLKEWLDQALFPHECVISIHEFDPSLDKAESFLKSIYLSYLGRLKYETSNRMIFDRVIVSRTDVIFFPKIKESFPKALFGQNLNMINGSKPLGFRLPAGLFTFDSPNLCFDLLPSAYDFTFFGSVREINILMRTYLFLDLIRGQYLSAHLLIAIVMKRFGIHLGDVNNYLAPKIFRKEKDKQNQYFTVDQLSFDSDLSAVRNLVEQNDRIWWSIVNKV